MCCWSEMRVQAPVFHLWTQPLTMNKDKITNKQQLFLKRLPSSTSPPPPSYLGPSLYRTTLQLRPAGSCSTMCLCGAFVRFRFTQSPQSELWGWGQGHTGRRRGWEWGSRSGDGVWDALVQSFSFDWNHPPAQFQIKSRDSSCWSQ